MDEEKMGRALGLCRRAPSINAIAEKQHKVGTAIELDVRQLGSLTEQTRSELAATEWELLDRFGPRPNYTR